MSYFPLYVELNGKKCAVIGGGAVAFRKVRTLMDYGAFVEITAPRLEPELERFVEENKGNISVNRREYKDQDLNGAFLVIAATNDEVVNRQIGISCHERKIAVNVVDDQKTCDFFFPALIKRGEVVVGISTGGKSPTLSRQLKEQIDEVLPEHLGEVAEDMIEYRDYVSSKVKSRKNRKLVFEKMLESAYARQGKLDLNGVNKIIEEFGGV
ncbi:MAG: bifunctional precorrin-2 dehydrogenase/sirohydrochlorin ferrochelatase [Lachnospiraceae bacterium]